MLEQIRTFFTDQPVGFAGLRLFCWPCGLLPVRRFLARILRQSARQHDGPDQDSKLVEADSQVSLDLRKPCLRPDAAWVRNS